MSSVFRRWSVRNASEHWSPGASAFAIGSCSASRLGWGRDLHGKTHRQRVAGVWRSSALRQGGLCEYDQHLSIFEFLCVSASLENRVIEYVDHLHEHFIDPVSIVANTSCPRSPGTAFKFVQRRWNNSLTPHGEIWGDLPRNAIYLCANVAANISRCFTI